MRSRARRLPMIVAATVATVVTVGLVVSAVAGHHGVRREGLAPQGAQAVRSQKARARELLRAWDCRRAAAWASDDIGSLRALYVAGSVTGRRDVRILQDYRVRGLRVTGMARQVLRFRVRSEDRRRLTLLVTDRLVDARVVGHGVGYAVPEGRPVMRRVTMTREAGGWRVAEVELRQPAR